MSLPVSHHPALVHLPAAVAAIAKAKTIDEVKKIRDMAEAVRAYACKAGLALEAQLDAAEIKVRAERRAGEMLRDMDKNKGAAAKRGDLRSPRTLAEIGVGKKQSERWQKAAIGMSEKAFNAHLDRCRKDGRLTSRSVLRAVALNDVKDPGPLPSGQFRAIYADPPWLYDNTGFDQAAQGQYNGQTIQQICAWPVNERAGKDSILFLWVTTPMSVAAVDVVRAWGFSFRSKMYWLKPRSPGMGFWVRGRVEELWIAVKGKPHPPAEPPDNIIESPVSRHSKKPDMYGLIESITIGPYLEMYAREAEPRKGWKFWGNQKGDEA